MIEDADYVIENLDANNLKALMRRAHAFRQNFRFDLALRDLKKLRSLMNPNDKAIQEVKKFHNMCVRGAAQNGIPFPTTPFADMNDMNPRTESWITEFRECPNTQSIITFLKLNGSYQTLTQVFHRTTVPREMFS